MWVLLGLDNYAYNQINKSLKNLLGMETKKWLGNFGKQFQTEILELKGKMIEIKSSMDTC